MAEETREQLKKYFETGDIPTQEEFANLIDSFIHAFEDGLKIYIAPDDTKRLGIGWDEPESPLGIQATGDDLAVSILGTDGTRWHISLNPTEDDKKGFSIEEGTPAGKISRLFVQQGTGKVGMGNVDPTTKLHITDANTGSATAIKIENALVATEEPALVNNRAWQLGHIHDPSFLERMGAFSIMEETTSVNLSERITVLPSRNVGVNEPLPDTTLHVNRSIEEPGTKIAMTEGSGIVMIGGLVGPHLQLDHQALQARTGTVEGTALLLAASKLSIQPLGGDIEIHGDEELPLSSKIIVKSDGKIGVGTLEPGEQLHLTGAVIVGGTGNLLPAAGTIRYNTSTSDLEGFVSGAWASLTGNTGSGFWQSAGTDKIRYNTPNAKVGIGLEVPTSALHVVEDSLLEDGNSTGATIRNASVLGSQGAGTRIGLQVTTDQTWSSSANAKNIGFYVSSTGMNDAHQNIAAVVNGNLVIGSVGAQIVGEDGNNVLAIQNGATPAGPPGGAEDGIQIYSADRNDVFISTFHVMNGDGTVMRLYRHTAMSADLAGTIDTGHAATDAILQRMRVRITELESILKNLGILPVP